MSEARSPAHDTCDQLDESNPSQANNVSERSDDIDGVHKQPTRDLQDLNDQATCGVTALERIQLLCCNAGLCVPARAFGKQRLISKRPSVIAENPALCVTLTAGSVVLEPEKVLLHVDNLKAELYS